MPRKRNSTEARKAPAQARGSKQAQKTPLVHEGAWHDIGGVCLVVLAIALAISLVSPSQALLARASATMLTYGFGAGAMLVPAALLLYAITLFLPTDGPISGRAALGLTLIVTAVLAMLSVLGEVPETPTFDSVRSAVFEPNFLVAHGGYWGGALAWVLLSLFDQVISLVILSGIVIAGIVVCGFSISDLVSRINQAHANQKAARAERKSQKQQVKTLDEHAPTRMLGRKGEATKTSFLGKRKTRVLKRGQKDEPALAAVPMKHPPLDLGEDETDPMPTWQDEGEEGAVAPLPAAATKHLKRMKTQKLGATTPPWMDAPSDEKNPDQEAEEAGAEEAEAPAKGSKGGQAKRTQKASAQGAPDAAGADQAVAADVVGETGAGAKMATPRGKNVKRPGDESTAIELPPMSILSSNPHSAASSSSDTELRRTAERLQSTLEEFGLKSRVKGWVSGPLVTTFKIEMGEGERVNKITNLEDDIALSLAAASVRIFAPIPGTSLVGIEIPNGKRTNVCLGDVLPFADGGPLQVAFGRDSEGKPVVVDLARLPHLLVAGTTGSGKSVMLNSAIMSILMRATPEQVRLIMVDPKRVEFTGYAGLPHLYVPVVNEPQKAASALQWGVSEMERRLKIFERASVRDIRSFNKMVAAQKDDEETPYDHMPYLVIVIDELADLMMVAGKDVEASIVRIAQLGRAAGIHLIVATQRPSADVVTGLIKANIDNRVALSVDNGMNSRIIIDQKGAEKLLGNGDMLVKLRGKKPVRVQGCYVSDPEIEAAVDFLRSQGEPDYHDEILSAVAPSPLSGGYTDDEDDDPLLWEAASIVVDSQLGSTSGLQRRLKVGYARAGRIMDMLEHKGIVGPPDGSKPREVLLDQESLAELKAASEQYREV